MRFNPKARLDTSRVQDAGGGGGMGGGGMGGGPTRLPLPGGVRAGGGLAGLIITILFIVLAQCAGVSLPSGTGTGSLGGGFDTSQMVGSNTGRYNVCKTGADIETHPDCEYVAVENSLRDYWSSTDLAGGQFQPATVETFTGSVSTGCGAASSDTGPFYCPPDMQIYLDTTFFKDVLEQQLGGPQGQFVIAYVVAHEYGHHIQHLRGIMSQVKTQQGPHSDSVKLELQADCYAGIWANHATTTKDAQGQVLIQDLTDQDIQEGIDAATAVGDDTIQERTGGQSNPEQWTHGSSEERVHWFTTGLQQGTLDACDTFAPGAV
jgi:predicted metalloprotease